MLCSTVEPISPALIDVLGTSGLTPGNDAVRSVTFMFLMQKYFYFHRIDFACISKIVILSKAEVPYTHVEN